MLKGGRTKIQDDVLKYFQEKYLIGIIPFFTHHIDVNPVGLYNLGAVSVAFLAPKRLYKLLIKPWILWQRVLSGYHVKFRLGQAISAFTTAYREIPEGYIFCEVHWYTREEGVR